MNERYIRLTLWLAVTLMEALWELGSKVAIDNYSNIFTYGGTKQGLSIQVLYTGTLPICIQSIWRLRSVTASPSPNGLSIQCILEHISIKSSFHLCIHRQIISKQFPSYIASIKYISCQFIRWHKQQRSDPATLNNTSDNFEFGWQAAPHTSGMNICWLRKILNQASKHPSTLHDCKRINNGHCVKRFGKINVC